MTVTIENLADAADQDPGKALDTGGKSTPEIIADVLSNNQTSSTSDNAVEAQVQEALASMEEDYSAALASIDSIISSLEEETLPEISAEGIDLGSSASASSVSSQTSASTVSITTESSLSAIAEAAEKLINGTRPEIILVSKLPALTPEDAVAVAKLSQAERKIVEEVLDAGLTGLTSVDETGNLSLAATEFESKMADVSKKIEIIGALLDKTDTASTGFDLLLVQDQIMSEANTLLADVIQTFEAGNSELGTNIADYITKYFSNIRTEDVTYTNSSMILNLFLGMIRACESQVPICMSSQSSSAPSNTQVYASVSEAPTILSGEQLLPKTRLMCRPHEYSILSLFNANHLSKVRQGAEGRLNQNRTSTIENGVKNASEVSTENGALANKMLSVISQIINLSNEFITSAGIGRLAGSALGERFLLTNSPEAGITQYLPYHKVLGEDPNSGVTKLSRFWSGERAYPGGLTDYLALGEEADDPSVIVFPFENSSISMSTKKFLDGRKYFIDLALDTTLENESRDARNGLIQYASQIGAFGDDVVNYMTELLAIDQNTSLSPEMILARILKDFSTVLSNLSKDASARDPKSDFVAGLLANSSTSYDSVADKIRVPNSTIEVSSVDMISALTLVAISDYDQRLEDSSYKLSGSKTNVTFFNEEGEYDTLSSGHAINRALNTIFSNSSDSYNPYAQSYTGGPWVEVTEDSFSNDPNTPTVLSPGNIYENGFVAHDESFGGGYNFLNLIAATCREIQYEALSLAKRDGAESDYRSESGNSLFSGMDDDRFVRLMVEIYASIGSLVLPCGMFIRPDGDNEGKAYAFATPSAATASQILIDTIINHLVNGQKVDELIFDKSGVLPSTQLNKITNTDQNGYRFYARTDSAPFQLKEYSYPRVLSDGTYLKEIAAAVQLHRYGIKSAIKVIETIPRSLSAAAAELRTTYDIINGDSVTYDDLSDDDKILYDMFRSNQSLSITPEQTNLKALDYYNFLREDDDSLFAMRASISISKAERAASLDYIKEVYEKFEIDDLYLFTVGIPAGGLKSVQRPVQAYSRVFSAVSPGYSGKVYSDVSLEVQRDDQAFICPDIVPSIVAKSVEIDPEIFILPGSIKYDPNSITDSGGSAAEVLEKIHLQTTYYKIRNGAVIETLVGSETDFTTRGLRACLESYLLDLLQYDLFRIRNYEFLDSTDYEIFPEAYTFLKEISSSETKSKAVLCKPGFSDLLTSINNSENYEIKKDIALKEEMQKSSLTGIKKFSPADVRHLMYLSSMAKVSDPSRALKNKPFDRVYNFLYDEEIQRKQLKDSEMIGQEKTEKEAEKTIFDMRKEYDLFSLSVKFVSQPPEGS